MAAPRPLLVVTGTRREGAAVAGLGVIVVAGGGDAARLEREIERHAADVCGILSFGMAGALDPALKLGDWVVGTGVTDGTPGGAILPCDPVFGGAMAARLKNGRRLPAHGLIHADGTLVARAGAKAARHAATGAIAADMESHIAAAAAARHGLRFAVLRCISDVAVADLPPAIAVAMAPGGGLAPLRIACSLLRHPLQVPALIVTTRRFARAFKVLSASGGRALRSV